MNVLCIGESLLEITCPVNEPIKEGAKLVLKEKQEVGGGHAGNVAYLLGKWGVDTHIASMVGADDYAEKIKKEFESVNVHTDYIETSFDRGTTWTLVLTNQASKENTVYKVHNNSYLKKYSFLIEPGIIFSDGNDFNASLSAYEKFSKSNSVLMVQQHNNEVLELCRYYKHLIFNKKSAEEYSNIMIDFNNSGTLVNAFNKLKQKFSNSEVVITLGEKGCVYSNRGQIKIIPPINISVVDSYGAGDVFAGAYVFGLSRDFDYEKTLLFAVIASSLSATKVSSRASIPSITEVNSYFEGKFGHGQAQTVNQNNVQNNAQAAEAQSNQVNMNTETPNQTPQQAPQAEAPAAPQNNQPNENAKN